MDSKMNAPALKYSHAAINYSGGRIDIYNRFLFTAVTDSLFIDGLV
jgi:hypothetical protein